MVREREVPGWLGGLIVEESFFMSCVYHESRRKNEKNMFCLDCCTSICPHCLPSHPSHTLLQVRRYVYNDVVRLDDLEKLVDCSHVQPYTINSAKVVFLKPRPQSRPFKGSGNVCLTCDRILQEPFHFCCLSCKVDHVVVQGEDISSILYRSDESDIAFSNFESLRMDGGDYGEDVVDVGQMVMSTPASVLEVQYKSCCSGSSTSSTPRVSSRRDTDNSSDKVKRKKGGNGGGGFFSPIVYSLGSRRKGAPHRSPLS